MTDLLLATREISIQGQPCYNAVPRSVWLGRTKPPILTCALQLLLLAATPKWHKEQYSANLVTRRGSTWPAKPSRTLERQESSKNTTCQLKTITSTALSIKTKLENQKACAVTPSSKTSCPGWTKSKLDYLVRSTQQPQRRSIVLGSIVFPEIT
jgi:hypothetical protein